MQNSKIDYSVGNRLGREMRRNGEYGRMVAEQGGVCAVCGKPEARARGMCIDHDHHTLEVRGLTCSRCNLGMGFFGDNVEKLQEAIDYLKRHSTHGETMSPQELTCELPVKAYSSTSKPMGFWTTLRDFIQSRWEH